MVAGVNAALYIVVAWLVADSDGLRALRHELQSVNLDLLESEADIPSAARNKAYFVRGANQVINDLLARMPH